MFFVDKGLTKSGSGYTRAMNAAEVEKHVNELIEGWGGREGLIKRNESMKHDFRFFWSHIEEWRQQYSDHWIGVYEEKFIAAERDPELLRKRLKKAGIPAGDAVFKYIVSGTPVIVV